MPETGRTKETYFALFDQNSKLNFVIMLIVTGDARLYYKSESKVPSDIALVSQPLSTQRVFPNQKHSSVFNRLYFSLFFLEIS